MTPKMATDKVKRTATPWELHQGDLHDHGPDGHENGFTITMQDYGRDGGTCIHAFRYAEEVFPDYPEYPEAKANAEFIVLTVNCHEELVEACKQVIEICEEGDTGADFDRVVAAMKTCAAALKKSEAPCPTK